MQFDQILATVDGKGHGEFPEGWGQGRALFGGLVGAVMYDHLCKSVAPAHPLRSFSLSFVAPATPGPVSLESRVLREGKSVMQAQVTASQQGQVVAVMLLSLGAARDSAIRVAPEPAPSIKPADQCTPMPYIAGVIPEFIAHFDMRWASGGLPFSGMDRPDFSGYMGFREPPAVMSTAALIALVDTWPPAVLPLLKKPAPASSLTWTMELVDDPASRPADQLWQYQVVTEHCAEGYGQSRATVHDADGRLVALSRQTVTVFA
ncbi:tesB-like acyl-CoA thioesterase [Alcanivorax hongdengensis A-11-3]|uniref:TesB-like acyl-CoA thioesterase n=1 Tax=Alcanivorax hongdengensis A-11-3 TaxID=1177179 RepID=L0WGW0_9GAMM|nr:thioesterase family protein [Alcanivorax hongdengensis]EKF75065.1 tesB-like acyl-CoA thioesterase [Alcanivorax hongdengensis A-11-3]